MSEGSVEGIEEIPVGVRLLYRTAWELPQKALIDMAAARGPYIDQSHRSTCSWLHQPSEALVDVPICVEERAQTTYYLRTRPATRITQTTTQPALQVYSDEDTVACSLENPEECEACQ